MRLTGTSGCRVGQRSRRYARRRGRGFRPGPGTHAWPARVPLPAVPRPVRERPAERYDVLRRVQHRDRGRQPEEGDASAMVIAKRTAASRHSPGERRARLVLVAVAAVGFLFGAASLVQHLGTDPLADVHAYYDAGARLNAGQPLYPPDADPDAAAFYRYPPLLAIAFRPLALLPFEAAAAIWETLLIVAFALTLVRLGMRFRTVIAVGVLALPIAWSLAVGQAQVLVTLLLALGSPLALAVATNLKLFPALAALYWVGRGDTHPIARFVAWTAALIAVQVVLEPAASRAFLDTLSFSQVGDVTNWSPYAASPAVWAILVAAGVGATLVLARSRAGWPAAVALSTLATPRLLTYVLMSLLACLAPAPSDAADEESSARRRRTRPGRRLVDRAEPFT